jgi:hypothetical protein
MILAQKEITQEEYSTQYYAALEKARDFTRRNVSKYERYRDGKVYETTEWLYEYILPYRRRFTYSKRNIEENVRFEEINIDETNYCSLANGLWTKVPTTCIQGFPATTSQASVQVLNKVSSRYTFEEGSFGGSKTKIYREYIKYKNEFSPDKEKEGLSFRDSTFWLNEKGIIIRQLTTSGLIGTEKQYSKWIDTYEYNPKDIKIEAPIK